MKKNEPEHIHRLQVREAGHAPDRRCPKKLRTYAAIDAATDHELNGLAALCSEEPADFEGCLPCYAYKVQCDREEAAAESEKKPDHAFLEDLADRIQRVSSERITGDLDLCDADRLREIARRQQGSPVREG